MMHNDATPMSADLCTADGLGICYVTDENFLFPTLLSLISLRRFVPVDVAPVFVVIFGAESIDLRSIKGAVRHLGATLIDATHREIPGMSDFDWSTTHVTAASIGRFLLDGLLPPGVRRILYIDGDTMVVGSLAPLLNYRPPEGAFAAADDAISLYRSDGSANGRSTRAYFSGIGLRIDQCYFNAGIFLVERNTWATITEKALAFLLVHPERCIYHDQSALNATVGGARIRLSPIWNFQTRYRLWGTPQNVEPRILHFTGAAKPWLGELAPWQDVARTLAADASALSTLSLPVRGLSQADIDRHNAQFTGSKEWLRQLIDMRRKARVRAIVRLHKAAVL